MFRNISKYLYFNFIPYIILGILTIVLFINGTIPTHYLIYTLIGWALYAGLGVAVGFHRLFSHNNFSNLAKWKENFILFCGTMSGEGSSITWTAIHIGYHHPHSDTDKDPHTPNKGWLHAFIGWPVNITENNSIINMKYAVRLARKSNHVWFHNYQRYILWGFPLLLALIDWKFALAASCLPTCLALIGDNFINIAGHTKMLLGYRNFETSDNSYNNPVTGLLLWGQGWHNNHHKDPKAFDFGTQVSGKIWEFDPCRIFIPFLK